MEVYPSGCDQLNIYQFSYPYKQQSILSQIVQWYTSITPYSQKEKYLYENFDGINKE